MKKLFNSIGLIIGISLTAIACLDKDKTEQAVAKKLFDENHAEEWRIKEGSIYDGDTLRVVRGNEELKIRFCGIDAPEKKQKLGIESRDYLRSLVARGNGTIYVMTIEKDRYGRTVAELFVPLKSNPEHEIHLNTEMVSAGMAWHYKRYSGNCHAREELSIAENNAKEDRLGVYSGNHQPPWEFRKQNK